MLFKDPNFADRRLLVWKHVPIFDKDDLSSIPTLIKLSNMPCKEKKAFAAPSGIGLQKRSPFVTDLG